jgi:hypothetical protein
LQGIANGGRFITQPKQTSWKMLVQLIKLTEQAFQGRPASKINDFTGAFVKRRTVVLGIIDIKAYIDYISIHRRLRFAFAFSGTAYLFEVFISDDSPRFG